MRNQKGTPNDLVNESSPYLLQHAYNPVNWVSWSPDIFKKAKAENKLVLVSIGYSSCHWCHVMEHESFEDEVVAEFMNKYFICVKVDREERPDVDQLFMTAVQLMTGQGGWPLNCITLPNGNPIYGGTYFQKGQWMQILEKMADLYRNEPDRLEQYSEELKSGIQDADLIQVKSEIGDVSAEKLDEILVNWKRHFDQNEGGPNKAPKFPLPNNYDFLLRYYYHTKDTVVKEHVELTLDKMANGGIFDQIGGGFSRYSVDALWKVPHFEKMLYDNAQLIGTYADGYKVYKKEHYKEVVEKTYNWLEREMKDASGSYYAALDADSEGVEGKFYVWKIEELRAVLKQDYDLAAEIYNINSLGFWEHGNYILMRSPKLAEIANSFGLTLEEIQHKIEEINSKLLAERTKRVRPGLDDKSLTAWNALLISGLVKAYQAFNDQKYLKTAVSIADWIIEKQLKNGNLKHTFKGGKSTIDGFLDDYATVIQAFTDLYQVSFDANYFNKAKDLLEVAIQKFQNKENGMFYFTSDESELLVRQMETSDNVIPASNSIMARNLYTIGTILDAEKYKSQAIQMLKNMYDGMERYGSAFSNWGLLLMDVVHPLNEVVITGNNHEKLRKDFQLNYIPNAIFMGGLENTIQSPLAEGKFGESSIYVCQNKTCKLPAENSVLALKNVLS